MEGRVAQLEHAPEEVSPHLDLYEMLRRLLEDLEATGEIGGEDFEDLEPIIQAFCKHKRVLRILLTLCE